MAKRRKKIYTVFLAGGASLEIKAARFEQRAEGIVFFGEDGAPLEDTFIDPASVIAVVPPQFSDVSGVFPNPSGGRSGDM